MDFVPIPAPLFNAPGQHLASDPTFRTINALVSGLNEAYAAAQRAAAPPPPAVAPFKRDPRDGVRRPEQHETGVETFKLRAATSP